MRRSLLCLVFGLALVCPSLVAAESFSLNGMLADGGTLNGTVNIDPVSELMSGLNATVNDAGFAYVYGPGTSQEFMDNYVGFPPAGTDAYFLYISGTTITNVDLNLVLPLVPGGFTGGALCALSTPCAGLQNSSFNTTPDPFLTLTATPVASTPEPASLALVLTGALLEATRRVERRVGAGVAK